MSERRRMPDFVLVFENPLKEDEDDDEVEERRMNEQKRKSYLENLEKVGVTMEKHVIQATPILEKTYINITIPWEVARRRAEKLGIMVALKENLFSKVGSEKLPPALVEDYQVKNWSETMIGYVKVPKTEIKLPNVMVNPLSEIEEPEPYRCMCPFKNSKLDKYLYGDDHDKIFTETQRHQIAWEVLQTTKYTFTYQKKRKKEEEEENDNNATAATYTVTRTKCGIQNLQSEGAFSAGYPPHVGTWKSPEDTHPHDMNQRQVLDRYWARWGIWYKYQPLDKIRDYFGEKTAFYFAWLGFYTSWLMPVSIVGLIVFLAGLFGMGSNIRANEICTSNIKMCPQCPESKGCSYWILNNTCTNARLAILFDHGGTVFFAIFVAFWTVFFLEFWKRMSAQLAYHWNAMDVNEVERPSHQFELSTQEFWEPKIEKNPDLQSKARGVNFITGEEEIKFPDKLHYIRVVSTYAVLLMMVMVVIIFVIGTIIYRVSLRFVIQTSSLAELGAKSALLASLSGACINLVLIVILGMIYGRIAMWMTKWEMHRTQSDFDDQLSIKMFLFQFTNLYSSILYVAFIKGKFTGFPGQHKIGIIDWREYCAQGGCMFEEPIKKLWRPKFVCTVAQQMGIIMIGKQLLNQMKELFIPKGKQLAMKLWNRFRLRRYIQHQDDAEDGQELQEVTQVEVTKTTEMAIQFGFITFFVAAFPIAPLFALLNNWMEIRLDAQKYVRETQRPVAERAEDIGVWLTILQILGQIAVISNAFLIAFTSDFLPQTLYEYTEGEGSRKGYTDYSLAWAPNKTEEPCRYEAFRNDKNGDHTLFFWRLMAVRLAFVVAFEHVVFFIVRMIDVLVPDVPEMLDIRIQREEYLAKQALTDLPATDDSDDEDEKGVKVSEQIIEEGDVAKELDDDAEETGGGDGDKKDKGI